MKLTEAEVSAIVELLRYALKKPPASMRIAKTTTLESALRKLET